MPEWVKRPSSGASIDRPKMRAVASDDVVKQLAIVTAKLGLSNAQAVRLLKACTLKTYLMPKSNPFCIAGTEAGTNYHHLTKGKKGHTEGLPECHIFASLINAAIEVAATAPEHKVDEGGMQKSCQEILKEYDVTLQSSKDLEGKVLCARFSKTYDSNVKRLEIHVVPALATVQFAIEHYLVHSGAELKLGTAPKGGLEREAQELLEKLCASSPA